MTDGAQFANKVSKVYLPLTVYEASKARIRWLFNEYECVIVSFSGGKDSTVCLNLALEVAEEEGRLPLPVMFLDQEAEWTMVIDYIRSVMHDPRVEPYWIQAPFRLSNSTSVEEEWLHCWREGDEWMRPKEPDSYHENVFGTDRFAPLFPAIQSWIAKGRGHRAITGVRADESPARQRGLTSYATYKGETWGSKDQNTMHPIYDWSTSDVWHAIESNGWPYCKLYDKFYQHGLPPSKMRVSSLTHETAIKGLEHVQEIDPPLWNHVTNRLAGVNTAARLREALNVPKQLPPMFESWQEYRDYLLANLVKSEEHRAGFKKQIERMTRLYVPEIQDTLAKRQISMILANDFSAVKLSVLAASMNKYSINQGKNSRRERERRAEKDDHAGA